MTPLLITQDRTQFEAELGLKGSLGGTIDPKSAAFAKFAHIAVTAKICDVVVIVTNAESVVIASTPLTKMTERSVQIVAQVVQMLKLLESNEFLVFKYY